MSCLFFVALVLLAIQVIDGRCLYCLKPDCQCNACPHVRQCNSCCGNHSAALLAGLFTGGGNAAQGARALNESQYPAYDFASRNDTEYLIATIDDSCLQIPKIMETKSIFCHGPYPKAGFDVVEKDWVAGKGSCKAQGAACHRLAMHESHNGCSLFAGFDHGPTDASANVTDQKDMHVCHFTKWDFSHPLPLDQRQSSWYKKVGL